MLVLCEDKKLEDILKYGFKGEKPTNCNGDILSDEFYLYKLMTTRKKNGKYGKKGEEIDLLTFDPYTNSFNWDNGRYFYNEDYQKIVYTLIKDNIIEYKEPYDKDERIKNLEEKIRMYKEKIKELENKK